MQMLYIFIFNDPAPPDTYTLSLHDALPICAAGMKFRTEIWRSSTHSPSARAPPARGSWSASSAPATNARSEEHTSELQSRSDLVCRLLLEKKKISYITTSSV